MFSHFSLAGTLLLWTSTVLVAQGNAASQPHSIEVGIAHMEACFQVVDDLIARSQKDTNATVSNERYALAISSEYNCLLRPSNFCEGREDANRCFEEMSTWQIDRAIEIHGTLPPISAFSTIMQRRYQRLEDGLVHGFLADEDCDPEVHENEAVCELLWRRLHYYYARSLLRAD